MAQETIVTVADKLKMASEADVTLPHYTNTDNPIDFPKTNVIWEATLDNKFRCVVERINKRGGHLKVYEIETFRILLQQDVGLAYGAKFGPDIDDVEKWQSISVAVVDRDLKNE